MMKKVFVYLLIFIAASAAYSGELSISPEKPAQGDRVKFIYKDGGKFNTSNLMLYIYYFTGDRNEPSARGEEMALGSGGAYSATFFIPEGAVFLMAKIGDGEFYDINSGGLWNYLIRDNTGKIAEYANLKAGVSYLGNLPGNIGKMADFDKALNHLEKENELYPGNPQVLIAAAQLKFDLKKISREEFENLIENAVAKQTLSDNESRVKAVVRALRLIGKSEKAAEIEKQYIAANPKSGLAEEASLASIAEAESLNEFSNRIETFFRQYPNSSGRERVFSALIDGYLQKPDFESIERILKGYSDVPASAYMQIALAVLENDKIFPGAGLDKRTSVAAKYAEKAIAEAEGTMPDLKPDYMTQFEWARERESILGAAYETYGKIYNAKKSYDTALVYFNKAYGLLGASASPGLYEYIVEAHFNQKNYEAAYDFSKKALLQTKSTELIDGLFETLHQKAGAGGITYDAEFDSLLARAKEIRLNNLKKQMLEREVVFPEIHMINDISVDLNLIRGKVMIIELWASWCGPCSDALIALESVYNLYRGNKDVMAAAVNVWEKGDRDRVDIILDYVEEGDLDLPVYIDYKNLMPGKLNAAGLPVRYYIGKNGKMQFREIGFPGQEESVMNASDKIELLLSM